MASFRLPKIGEMKSTTEQRTQKRRRISTGSMHSSLSGSLEPSPPAIDKSKLAARRRTLKRSMSVPGLSLGLIDRDSPVKDSNAKRGSLLSRGSENSGQGSEQSKESVRLDMRVRAEREFRVVSAKVSDFCTRTAASVHHRDDRLIDTVDCMEDADVAAERLFMNNTVLRRTRRHGFMPDIVPGPPGANQPREVQSEVSPQVKPHPGESQFTNFDRGPPDRDLDDEEAANEMVERISRWLEDVERMKRDPSEDLTAGISLVALT